MCVGKEPTLQLVLLVGLDSRQEKTVEDWETLWKVVGSDAAKKREGEGERGGRERERHCLLHANGTDMRRRRRRRRRCRRPADRDHSVQ